VLLAHAHRDDSLADIDPPALLPILQTAAPSREIVTFCGGEVFLGRGPERRFVNFRVAAVDFEFLDAGGLFEFSDVEGLHVTNIIAPNDQIYIGWHHHIKISLEMVLVAEDRQARLHPPLLLVGVEPAPSLGNAAEIV